MILSPAGDDSVGASDDLCGNIIAGKIRTGKKRKKRIIIAVILIILIALCVVACAFYWISSMERKAVEEEARRESIQRESIMQESILQESIAEQERLEQEALEEAERLRVREEYISNVNSFSKKVAEGTYLAAYVCYTTKSVWYDSIFNVYDEDTVMYTQTDGKFHDDFNDSLEKLYNSEDISNKTSKILENREEVVSLYKSLLDPPPEFEECFAAAKSLFSVYLDITQLSMGPSGSLNSYTEEYLEYYDESVECFTNLKVLIPEE